jgi:agmatine deiminase
VFSTALGLLVGAVLTSPPAGPPPLLQGDYEAPDAVALVFSETWQPAWRTMTIALATELPVVMFRESIADEPAFRRALARLPADARASVEVVDFPVDTPWVRDWGPLQAKSGSRVVWLDAPYSAARGSDDMVPQMLGERFAIDVQGLPASIDGGAVASNGRGLCVMTIEYRDAFAGGRALQPEALGCRALAFVPALADESTMHADMLAQFVAADVLVLAEVDAQGDPDNATRLEAAGDLIRLAADRLGQPLQVVRVPMSPPDDQGVYRPYVNFLQAGATVLVPEYASVDPQLQARAHAILRRLMPSARHVGVDAEQMAASGGSVHCVTLGLRLSPRGMGSSRPVLGAP